MQYLLTIFFFDTFTSAPTTFIGENLATKRHVSCLTYKTCNKVTEQELAEQCLKRKTRAEREVFTRYGSMLRGICFRYADNEFEAEEMFQEGFIRIFDTIKTFTWRGDSSFTAWMRKVMLNNAINIYKKNKRAKLLYVEMTEKDEALILDNHEFDAADHFGISAVLAAGITQENLFDMLQQLPEMYRVVFNLAAIDNVKHREIAEMLGIDESSSRSRLLRAKTMLRNKLEDYAATHSKMQINHRTKVV